MNESRIKAYALAAGGGAAMATVGVAQADIITSDGSVSIPVSDSRYAGIVTLFSTAGIQVVANNSASGVWSTNTFNAAALVKARTWSTLVTGSYVQFTDVNAGVTIDADLASETSAQGRAIIMAEGRAQSTTNLVSTGGLGTGSERLLALNIDLGPSDSLYGWINYTLSFSEGSYLFTINSWAYNDVANEGIIAGQNTAAGSSAVPGLGGLAALAIGAAGIRSRRQRVA